MKAAIFHEIYLNTKGAKSHEGNCASTKIMSKRRPSRRWRNTFRRFLRTGTLIATCIHSRYRVLINLSGRNIRVTERRRLYQFYVDLDRRPAWFVAIHVVSGEVGISVRSPHQVNKGRLSGT